MFLTVLGFGMGNLKDSTMEKLADKGNGNYAYIDSLARGAQGAGRRRRAPRWSPSPRTSRSRSSSTRRAVAAYRLIGYENRMLADEDFNDDKKDAGDIGAGHTRDRALRDRAGGRCRRRAGASIRSSTSSPPAPRPAATRDELMTVKLRYKEPDGDDEPAARGRGQGRRRRRIPPTSASPRPWPASACCCATRSTRAPRRYAAVLELARQGRGEDPDGYRAEFIQLIESARTLAESETPRVGG